MCLFLVDYPRSLPFVVVPVFDVAEDVDEALLLSRGESEGVLQSRNGRPSRSRGIGKPSVPYSVRAVVVVEAAEEREPVRVV